MTNMDISDTLAPKSEQLDAIDLLSGPQVFTITKVDVKPGAEQPVSVHFAEFPRAWRPCKNMRRVLGFCWTTDSDEWVGKRVELYCDAEVVYAGRNVGGTRISRVSGIDGPKSAPVLNGNKPGIWKVDPLPDAPVPEPLVTLTPEEFDTLTVDQLRACWKPADAKMRTAIEARVKELEGDQ